MDRVQPHGLNVLRAFDVEGLPLAREGDVLGPQLGHELPGQLGNHLVVK
jgi:hypothetical protein